MLSKAACMGDLETFKLIQACPKQDECKLLGRQIKPWNKELWDKNVV